MKTVVLLSPSMEAIAQPDLKMGRNYMVYKMLELNYCKGAIITSNATFILTESIYPLKVIDIPELIWAPMPQIGNQCLNGCGVT